MQTVTSNNINYKSVQQYSGKYRYLRIPMNNVTGNTVTLEATGSKLIEFKLPVTVYNLGRSVFSYTDQLPLLLTKYTYAHDCTLEIAQSIQFGTSGGLNLMDLQYANNYINVARPIDTPVDIFMSNDITSGLYKATNRIINPFPPAIIPDGNNIYGITEATIAPTEMEPQYVKSSVLAKGVTHTRNFPLSGVTGTIVGMDRDQYFPDNMYLRINTAPSGKVGFGGGVTVNDATGGVDLVTQPKLNNVYLYLAIEKDPVIIDNVMRKYNEGSLKYQIPYISSYRNAIGAGSSTIQLQLTNQLGKRLKRVLTANFNPIEKNSTAYDHSNWDGLKATNYQTYLDSQPLQDSISSCRQPDTDDLNIAAQTGLQGMDDWRENSIVCRGSAIQNSASYQINWFHCDRWAEKNMDSLVPDENIIEGLDLSTPKAWSIQQNMATASVNYSFCSFSRDLAITPVGPVFV